VHAHGVAHVRLTGSRCLRAAQRRSLGARGRSARSLGPCLDRGGDQGAHRQPALLRGLHGIVLSAVPWRSSQRRGGIRRRCC